MSDSSPSADAAPISRRTFVAGAAALGAVGIGAAALVGLSRKTDRPLAGALMEDGHVAGHRIRDGGGAAPTSGRVERTPIVIVGGGIAGLSAAWWLQRAGMRDFVLLELEREPGGNSRSGANAVSAYPWGAHYVPVPNARAEHVRLLFAEMGLLAADGTWSERDLCHTPKERLFVHGRWREGLEEALAIDAAGQEELRRFDERIDALRATGAFTIPLALGAQSTDLARAPLDGLTATEWLAREGFRSPALHWSIDYACRDDFGVRAHDASAWAALHYFAARDTDDAGPLTWPEGNGRLVHHLAGRVAAHVVTGAPVMRVERRGAGMRVHVGGEAAASGRAGVLDCDAVIWAAPTFVASHVVEGAPRVPWSYAPWMVANLTLDRRPRADAADAPDAWDNVIADSPALGYVDATHQALRGTPAERTVWTYYWALADGDPTAQRRALLAMDWRACAEHVLADLERAHPDIRGCVSRIDVMRHGHAMPRPVPGFLAMREPWWNPPRDARVLYANSDVSGLSLFEEAQYRGIQAAERAMALTGRG